MRPMVIAIALATSIMAFPPHAFAQPTHPGLVYGVVGGTPLRLDLYIPNVGAAPRPCVLWIHGGGWQGGSRTGIPAGCVRLLNLGIAVASVDYRLTSQAGQYGAAPVIFPAQIEDVKGAVRWLRANAATYGLDPLGFGSWGSSAGGHLSALLATSAGVTALEGSTGGNLVQSSAVQAFGDYFGPTDILHINDMVTNPPGSTINHDAYNSPESRLVGWDDPGQGIGDIKANLANPDPPYPALVSLTLSVDPIQHLDAADPPGFIAHGTDDTTVPIGQSVALADAMTAAGLAVTYRPVPGAGHSFLGTTTDSLAAEFFRARFLAGQVGIAPTDAGTRSRMLVTPNPTSGGVTLSAGAPFGPGDHVTIVDISGRVVRRLVPIAATRTLRWDGRDQAGRPAPPGVFVARHVRGSGSTEVVRIARIR